MSSSQRNISRVMGKGKDKGLGTIMYVHRPPRVSESGEEKGVKVEGI